MLTFSRGQRGEHRPVSLAPLIQEWIGLLESTLPSSVKIRTELNLHVPPALLYPLQIEHVLMNLCINARDAMQGQGRVTVSLRHGSYRDRVCTSCLKPVAGEFIEIAVSDTGPGLPDEVRERMFEPFYSTKDTAARVRQPARALEVGYI